MLGQYYLTRTGGGHVNIQGEKENESRAGRVHKLEINWINWFINWISGHWFQDIFSYKNWLWLGTCPVHSLVCLQSKDIICYFSSLLIKSDHLQLTSTISTAVLQAELTAIKHCHYLVSCLYWQPWGECFSYSWFSRSGCAVPPTSWLTTLLVPSFGPTLYHFLTFFCPECK